MIVTRHHRLVPQNAEELAVKVEASVEDMTELARDSQENEFVVRVLVSEKV